MRSGWYHNLAQHIGIVQRGAGVGETLPDAELRPSTPSHHIMVMAAALRQFTVEEVEAFPYDGNRYELLHGLLLVTPQPGLPHQVVASRLMLKLGLALVDQPTVQLYAPGTVQIRPSIHLEPDLLIGSLPGALGPVIGEYFACHDLAIGAGFPVVGQV